MASKHRLRITIRPGRFLRVRGGEFEHGLHLALEREVEGIPEVPAIHWFSQEGDLVEPCTGVTGNAREILVDAVDFDGISAVVGFDDEELR